MGRDEQIRGAKEGGPDGQRSPAVERLLDVEPSADPQRSFGSQRSSCARAQPLYFGLLYFGLAAISTLWTGAACGNGDIDIVQKETSFTPSRLDFGVRTVGALHALSTTLTVGSGRDTSVREIRTLPSTSVFAARLGDGGTLNGAILAGGSATSVTILFSPVDERTYETEMMLSTRGNEVPLTLSGTGRIPRPAEPELSPSRVDFEDPVEVGREVLDEVTLTNVGELAGALSSFSNAPYFITGREGVPLGGSALGPGQSLPIEVRFRPTEIGTFDRVLRLALANTETELLVSGTSTPAGTLACDATAIEFGAVPRGDSSARRVRCNVVEGQYTLRSIEVAGTRSGFSVTDSSHSAGTQLRSLAFSVEFKSEGATAQTSAIVRIASFHGSVVEIPVSAAVAPPRPEATDLSLTLTWTPNEADLDLHLVKLPGAPYEAGLDCHWETKTLEWGDRDSSFDDPFLDRDSVEGPGGEQINLIDARQGRFDVWVQYFGYETPSPVSTEATVRYSMHQATAFERRRIIDQCGLMWRVGTFDFFTGTGAFTPSDELSSAWKDETFECR